MDIIEVVIQDESRKFSTINQIRKMLSLNFYVKSQAEIKDYFNGKNISSKT